MQENNKSTLLIDLDSQKSLTGTFETKDFNFKDKHNISEILSNPQIGIIATTVEKNIDVTTVFTVLYMNLEKYACWHYRKHTAKQRESDNSCLR